MPKYFLGLDGGQSRTTALIGDENGRVIGVGRGGPCNHVPPGAARTKFTLTIGGCVKQAREAAGLAEDIAYETACYGFSGGPADKDAVVGRMFQAGKRLVTHDAYIALCGAHAGAPGVITIAGTGSISFGRGAESQLMRAGGWGYVFGDEGGGFDLTRQALRDALLKATGAKDANDLMHQFYGGKLTRPQMAAMSRLVDKAAFAGDVVAYGILTEAAQQLAGITLAVRKRCFGPKECAPVAYIGGVFNSTGLLERFRTLLERDGLASVVAPKYAPAAGALLEAYRMAGLTVKLSGLPEAEK